MTFGELAPKTMFYFGRVIENRYNYRNGTYDPIRVEVPLRWEKTALNGLSICKDAKCSVPFDNAKTASGSNGYVRKHGHRLFTLTTLFKFLNCADNSYKQFADGDDRYFGNDGPGFLSRFNDQELKFIEPHSATIQVPKGYTKTYGDTVTYQTLVNLPSKEQIGLDRNQGTFGINPIGTYTWITDADTLNAAFRNGYIHRYSGSRCSSINPVIKIKDDAPVDRDGNGNYIIRVVEEDFKGDLFALLGWNSEEAIAA